MKTVAVCLKCGATKDGALAPCPSCKHLPKDTEDQARHLMLTSNFRSEAELHTAVERIKAGQEVEFDPAQLDVIKEEIPRLRNVNSTSCLSCFLILAALGLTGMLIYVLLWALFTRVPGPGN